MPSKPKSSPSNSLSLPELRRYEALCLAVEARHRQPVGAEQIVRDAKVFEDYLAEDNEQEMSGKPN